MSRSGYSDDCEDQWSAICWAGAVKSAIRGKRGQDFLRELLTAMDALPEKRLVQGELMDASGSVCAMGAVMKLRGLDPTQFDIYDYDHIAKAIGIAPALVREVEYENDEWDDARRFERVREWVVQQLGSVPAKDSQHG